MSDETYVDPNSGAAPQPGGYAGAEAAEKGFAIPADYEVENEVSPAKYEAPGGNPADPTVQELVDKAGVQEKTPAEQQAYEAVTNPKKVLADLDESDREVEVPEHSEEEASDAAAVEHEGVDVHAEESSEDGDDDDEAEASEEAYDPSAHTVPEVQKYIEENPDLKDAVLKAEKAGKNRSTLVD